MVKNLSTKFKAIFLFSFLIFALSFSFLAGRVFAADAVPAPGRIPCTDDPKNVKDPEFSSDRPYQGSPCGDRPISYWCSNDVVINLGTVKVEYCDKQSGQATECQCKSNCSKDQKIDVDLTDVQLPILGNTQLTKNSTSGDDQIDDGTKTSNYVAWYLGGTNDKAEYPTDPTTAEGISKIVDTSGPLKKLLPSIIQDAARITTIDSATKTVTYTPDGAEDNNTPPPTTEPENHNQIVVCANPDSSGFWSFLQNITGLGKFNPTDCYPSGATKAQGGLVMRLKDWNGLLGTNVVINAAIQGAIQGLRTIYPFIPAGAIETSIGDHWLLARPPLPWSDQFGLPFKTDVEYQKAYYEWRGNICAIIPFINKVVCFANIFVPTKYADLYQYVPLANTVDKKGAHVVNNTHIEAPRATLSGVAYQIIHSPQLYLSHSLEDYQLSNILKKTYLPGETATASAGGAGVSGTTIPKDVENNAQINGQCRIIPSRTNPGDDATFGNPKSHMEVQVQYTVEMIQCTNIHYVEPDPNCNPQTSHCGQGHWDADCSSDVYATVNTTGKFAYNDEIWNNTVAGSDSIFRRIYPKTGGNSPVSCIADNPAVSAATYTLSNNSSQGLELLRVIEPDKTAVHSEDGKVANAQLYYPHYGGVLDYFLNGIQQALRPQGYGPGTPQNGQFCKPVVPTDCKAGAVPDSAVPSKYLGAFKTNFIDLANRWSATCPGATYNLAEQCYNYVASEAKKAGVNPAFALTIWLNESGASNYCASGATAQDFGINLPALYQNITGQLQAFLNMAKMKLCEGVPGFVEPMHGWLSRFQSSAGVCNPSDAVATQYYYDVMNNTWTWVSGCPKNGKFGITWPTDMSCP